MAKKKEKPLATVSNTANIKHRKVAKAIVDNGGNVSKAMREVGYSDAYAKNPQKLLQTKSFQELLDEYLPDELLTSTHRELVHDEDSNIRLRSVDLGYKIKNKFEPEQHELIVRNYRELPDEELEKIYNAKANTKTQIAND